MKSEVKKLVDAYVEEQKENYDERFEDIEEYCLKFKGYIACLIDTGMIDKDKEIEVFDYMLDKFEGIEKITVIIIR